MKKVLFVCFLLMPVSALASTELACFGLVPGFSNGTYLNLEIDVHYQSDTRAAGELKLGYDGQEAGCGFPDGLSVKRTLGSDQLTGTAKCSDGSEDTIDATFDTVKMTIDWTAAKDGRLDCQWLD